MKIIFAGTPEISAIVLENLLAAGHEICAVLTQPDRPSGRGQKLIASSVKLLALSHEIPVYQPISLKDIEIQNVLQDFHADLMVVVAYGLIVPQVVLDIPGLGCWNVHVSLLPRWRGAAPIQRAIEAGDALTGVTIMQMDKGLDTGPILLQESVAILPEMTAGDLHDLLAVRGAALLVQALADPPSPKAQPLEGSTYAAKLTKEEARIDWAKNAVDIERKIRAFSPWPICFTGYGGQIIRVLKACALEGKKAEIGCILNVRDDAIGVQTGEGILDILSLQLPGGKPLDIKVFLNGRPDFFKVGSMFE
ncbi:MAG: methionyl-tRNA formyltransferase [Gammaproteobacteria bacterium]|nr:methionyl-tRNA formyltransferase [Gammaproteobacteria bacterium]